MLSLGFLKEELNHAAVSLEEAQLEKVETCWVDYVSGPAYNAISCMRDPHLVDLFMVPHNDVRDMLLSHNHAMLIMRVFLTSAQWEMKVDEQTGMIFCDDKGRLSIAAVAEHLNGKD